MIYAEQQLRDAVKQGKANREALRAAKELPSEERKMVKMIVESIELLGQSIDKMSIPGPDGAVAAHLSQLVMAYQENTARLSAVLATLAARKPKQFEFTIERNAKGQISGAMAREV